MSITQNSLQRNMTSKSYYDTSHEQLGACKTPCIPSLGRSKSYDQNDLIGHDHPEAHYDPKAHDYPKGHNDLMDKYIHGGLYQALSPSETTTQSSPLRHSVLINNWMINQDDGYDETHDTCDNTVETQYDDLETFYGTMELSDDTYDSTQEYSDNY